MRLQNILLDRSYSPWVDLPSWPHRREGKGAMAINTFGPWGVVQVIKTKSRGGEAFLSWIKLVILKLCCRKCCANKLLYRAAQFLSKGTLPLQTSLRWVMTQTQSVDPHDDQEDAQTDISIFSVKFTAQVSRMTLAIIGVKTLQFSSELSDNSNNVIASCPDTLCIVRNLDKSQSRET